MAKFDEVVAANKQFASSFAKGGLPMPPARAVAILTCMDARLHPEQFCGLDFGDAHVIRNAGGRASDDAVRSLVISQRLLGTDEIIVIHHTDCGMLTFSNEQLVAKITKTSDPMPATGTSSPSQIWSKASSTMSTSCAAHPSSPTTSPSGEPSTTSNPEGSRR